MKSKKSLAFFPEEIVKIVIAVICIAFLLYLVFSMVGGIFTQNRLENQAKGSLEEIEYTISNLEDGGQRDVLILNPKDWYLVYYKEGKEEIKKFFPGLHLTVNLIPSESCSVNCFCICPGIIATSVSRGIYCNDGFCKESENEFSGTEIERGIKISELSLKISKTSEGVVEISKIEDKK